MRTKALAEWFKFAADNGQLRQDFMSDISQMKTQKYFWQPFYTALGFAFAGIIWNPNFTSRNSYYLRKISPFFWGLIGYQWAETRYQKMALNTSLKNYDYYPYEVKRTLRDKDFRHMVDFDYEKAHKLYDQSSGKCLQ